VFISYLMLCNKSKYFLGVAGAGGVSTIPEETRLSTTPRGLEMSQTISLRLSHYGGVSSLQRKKVLEP
jgi:hypothetical protein